jgi:hypothetical protein
MYMGHITSGGRPYDRLREVATRVHPTVSINIAAKVVSHFRQPRILSSKQLESVLPSLSQERYIVRYTFDDFFLTAVENLGIVKRILPARRGSRVGAVLLLIVVAVVLYEMLGPEEPQDRRIGRAVDIGGRTLNIYCSGQGSPAVIFDTFGHQAGYSWHLVQPTIASFTTACWYDRAGYGWSEPGPMPRTYQAIAEDLHALLQAAGVSPPYVLVGAGDSASHIRVYNGLHPAETAGVVLINANDIRSVMDAEFAVGKSIQGPWVKNFGPLGSRLREMFTCRIYPKLYAFRRSKVVRMWPRRTLTFGSFDAEEQKQLDWLSDNLTARLSGGEVCGIEESEMQVRQAATFGDTPLIVLASRSRMRDTSPDAEAFNRYSLTRLLPRLAALSSHGRLVTVDDAYSPDPIREAIREVVALVRIKARGE